MLPVSEFGGAGSFTVMVTVSPCLALDVVTALSLRTVHVFKEVIAAISLALCSWTCSEPKVVAVIDPAVFAC